MSTPSTSFCLLRLSNATRSGRSAYVASLSKGSLYSPIHGVWVTTLRSSAKVFSEAKADAWIAKRAGKYGARRVPVAADDALVSGGEAGAQ